MRMLILGIMAAVLGLLALACGGEAATSSPTAIATSTSTPSALSEGQQVFISRGCAACHGSDAEGTGFAPPLAGHTAAQVKRQVRAPLGTMPVFPPDKVSNEEMEAITVFIDGLSGEHVHVQITDSPDELALHHWMALFSIEAGDPNEGIHHLGHIIALTEGEHRARMEQATTLLEEGDIDNAAHLIEEMLAGLEQVSLDATTIQLTLALSSARVEETDVAMHHVEHYIELVSGPERETGAQILALFQQGEVHDAENELEELLGRETSEPEHEDDHEDDHEDEHENGTEAPPSGA